MKKLIALQQSTTYIDSIDQLTIAIRSKTLCIKTTIYKKNH